MKKNVKSLLSMVSMPSSEHAVLLEQILNTYLSGYQNVTISIVRQPAIEPDVAAEWPWLENKQMAFERKAKQQILHIRQQMRAIKQVLDTLKVQPNPDPSAAEYAKRKMDWTRFVRQMDFNQNDMRNAVANFEQLWNKKKREKNEVLQEWKLTCTSAAWAVSAPGRGIFEKSSLSVGIPEDISGAVVSVYMFSYPMPRMGHRFTDFWKKEEAGWVCTDS